MKRTEPFDEIKQLFDATPVPRIDVKNQVLERVKERKVHREAFRVKKKVISIVAACFVFGVTSAFAAMHVYELKNSDGEVVVQVQKTAEEPVLDHRNTYMEQINQIRESLQPGTAVAAYVVTDNPDKIVSFLQKPVTSDDRSVLQAEAGTLFTFPEELVGGFLFGEGYVEHVVKHDYNKEEMYKEAEQTKKDVIIKQLEVEPDIQRLGATYANSKGEKVILNVDNFANVKYVSSEAGPDDTVETVKVNGMEAIYQVKKLQGSDTEMKSIQIYKEETKLLYEVTTSSTDISKEDLLAIAEKLV